MIAVPWYLFAGGTILVIVGLLAGGTQSSSKKRSKAIHHKMRDKDIIRQLNQSEAPSLSTMISFLGYVIIFISLIWRLILFFI